MSSRSIPEKVTSYVYDGWRAIEEYDGTNTHPDRQFVFGSYLDEPLTMDVNADDDAVCYINGGTVDGGDDRYYYHQNWQYSTVALSDPSGDLVEAYYYMPYGSHYRVTDDDGGGDPVQLDDYEQVDFMAASAIGNPYLYTGQRFDAETGMHYYKRRYYSADRARFISRDPLGAEVGPRRTAEADLGHAYHEDFQIIDPETGHVIVIVLPDGPNVYAYVSGMPLAYTDPKGTNKHDPHGFFACKVCKAGRRIKKPLSQYDPAANVNGCGAANGINVPDSSLSIGGLILKPNDIFGKACDKHDICYGTCNTDKSDFRKQKNCDDNLLHNMRGACFKFHTRLRVSTIFNLPFLPACLSRILTASAKND